MTGDGEIAVVDLTASVVVDRWDAGELPLDLIATADGWLVTQFGDSTLITLDRSGEPVPDRTFIVGRGPSLFTPDPARGLAWVTLEFADRLIEIDLETGAPSSTANASATASDPATQPSTDPAAPPPITAFATGDRPYPGDAMFDGSHVFVPNLEDGTVSVIDVLNDETDATVEACPGPPGGALTPDHVTYIVACGGSSEAVMINTASFEITGRVGGLGDRPFSATVSADGRYALLNNAGDSTVSVIDLSSAAAPTTTGSTTSGTDTNGTTAGRTMSVAQSIATGRQPIVIRRHPDGRRILVANEVAGTLTVLAQTDPGHPIGIAADHRDALEGRPRQDGSTLRPVIQRSPPALDSERDSPDDRRNEVIVVGVIHGQHETSELFSLEVFNDLIREIDPDYWMIEVTPNRWPTARDQFSATGAVTEPRVVRFPEYIGGLFPLSRELDFEVIPTAGWTEPMSDFRAAHLSAVSDDPTRAADWTEYTSANAAADSAIRAGGAPDDPRWINTDAYDAAYEIRLATYNRIFNEELGPGGWDNINVSHYANISRALDRHRGEGARFLITYGAGHKGWFLRALRQRDDITLLDVAPFLDRIGR